MGPKPLSEWAKLHIQDPATKLLLRKHLEALDKLNSLEEVGIDTMI